MKLKLHDIFENINESFTFMMFQQDSQISSTNSGFAYVHFAIEGFSYFEKVIYANYYFYENHSSVKLKVGSVNILISFKKDVRHCHEAWHERIQKVFIRKCHHLNVQLARGTEFNFYSETDAAMSLNGTTSK